MYCNKEERLFVDISPSNSKHYNMDRSNPIGQCVKRLQQLGFWTFWLNSRLKNEGRQERNSPSSSSWMWWKGGFSGKAKLTVPQGRLRRLGSYEHRWVRSVIFMIEDQDHHHWKWSFVWSWSLSMNLQKFDRDLKFWGYRSRSISCYILVDFFMVFNTTKRAAIEIFPPKQLKLTSIPNFWHIFWHHLLVG